MFDNEQAICKYNQTGFCKNRNNCQYNHVYEICKENACIGRTCNKRHPKECRQFKIKRYCTYNEKCAYKHTDITNQTYEDDRIKLVLEVMKKHENTINIVVEEILNIKSKIVKDELESTVRILSQEIRLLQVENKSMIYRLSQLEEEPEAKDESEEESDDDDSSEDDFDIKQALSHKNKQAVPFKCNMCDYKCENAITLSKHKNTKHNMTNTNESALMKDNDKIEQSNEHSNKKVRIADKSLVLTLPRVDLDEGELEDVKSHAKESGMNLDEFLLEMPKILEGYLRLNKDM